MPRERTVYWARCQYLLDGCAISKEFDIDGPYPLNAMNAIANMSRNSWGGSMLSCRLYTMDFDTGTIATDPLLTWGARDFQLRECVRENHHPQAGGYTSPEEITEAEEILWGPWNEYDQTTIAENPELTDKIIRKMGFKVESFKLPKFITIRFKPHEKELQA